MSFPVAIVWECLAVDYSANCGHSAAFKRRECAFDCVGRVTVCFHTIEISLRPNVERGGSEGTPGFHVQHIKLTVFLSS